MLDGLKTGLRAALKKIVNSSAVDEGLIKELSKDIQRALLQSDVLCAAGQYWSGALPLRGSLRSQSVWGEARLLRRFQYVHRSRRVKRSAAYGVGLDFRGCHAMARL